MVPFPVTVRLGKGGERFVFATAALPALFLDRDGIINVDTGYVGNAADVTVFAETCMAVRAANRCNIPVVVVSNQSAIGRNYFGWDMVAAVDEAIAKAFAAHDAGLDLILYAGRAPGTDEEDIFRKPGPGLFELAARIMPLDLKASVMVGDKPSDLEAAARAGLPRGVLLSANAADAAPVAAAFPQFMAETRSDLAEALSLALESLGVKSLAAS